MYKYITTITAAAAIHDDIINLRPKNLQEAVAYVEAHSKGGANSAGTSDRSSLKCSYCKATGHTVKTCRKKNAKGNQQRAKKVDEIALGDIDECEEDEEWGSPEEPEIDYISGDEYEEDVDMFPVGVEIEDLGKRKGTNDARDNIVKKLRQTPPNPSAAMGGYREIPVTKTPPITRGQYKTYKVVPDKAALARKEAKDTMTKPVSVPLNHFMGITMLATKNKDKLVNKLTQDATKTLEAYVETVEVDDADSPDCEVCSLEINPLQAVSKPSNHVS